MNTAPFRIGQCLSLSAALASNGPTAHPANQICQEKVNKNGKVLGRPVQLACFDDQTNPHLIADLYQWLLDVERVDLLIGGYGDNSVAPVMPLSIEPKRLVIGRHRRLGGALLKHTTWQSDASWRREPNRFRALEWPANSTAIGRRAQRASARSLRLRATTQALPALYSNGGCGCYGPRESSPPSAKALADCSALC
jgi:hypothetical protein